MIERDAADAEPRVGADAWSVMLYTSGTTAKPKGVPRRQHAERAAAVAHVAQNLYGHGERTLGVMPLYHTMGVRSLLAMSLIGGAFVCLPRFDAAKALDLIASERITNLYLVPTLYHDLVHHAASPTTDVSSVRKLGFAGAPMTDGLLKKLTAAFRPDLFVNHYGCSEIYTFTIDQNAAAKPGSAGRAGINQSIRVVQARRRDARRARRRRRGRRDHRACCSSDEAFEGYWRRPDADAKALREGWYFTGDTGYFDADGDLFVTGRVDDMIITGGENVSPVEIESCLSLHPAVSEVAVVGLPDERWGKVVTAFIKRRRAGGRGRARPLLPHLRAGQFQAAAALRLRHRNPEIPGRQTAAPQAGRRRFRDRRRNRNRSINMSDGFNDPRLPTLDGFGVEIDAAAQRADVVLDRPPLNVIAMPQRDQLRRVFEALDEDERVRVIVLRAVGEHFSSGGDIKGFMEASPEHVSKLAWNIAAPARCAKPVIAANRGYCFGVGFEISLACDFRLVSETCFYALAGTEARADPGLRRLGATAEDRRHHPHQGHRHALAAHPGAASL